MVDFLYEHSTGRTIPLHDPGVDSTYYIRFVPDSGVHSLEIRKISNGRDLWQTVVYGLSSSQHEFLLMKGIEVWA